MSAWQTHKERRCRLGCYYCKAEGKVTPQVKIPFIIPTKKDKPT